MIEAEAKFVDQVVAERVDLAGRQSLGKILAVAILKAAAVEVVIERRGQEITVVAVTEAGEKIIFGADGVVVANIELVLRFRAFGIGKESIGTERWVIGRGKSVRLAPAPSGSIAVLVPLLPVKMLVGTPAAVVPIGTPQYPLALPA